MAIKKFISIIMISFVLFATSCDKHIDYSNYKKEYGYSAYISDRNSGDETPFCNTQTSLEISKKAISYYKKNSRKVDDYIITNYEDGICINRVIHPAWWDYKIPETIDGRPVVKLGCYINEQGEILPFLNVDEDSSLSFSVYIPKTIKYIDWKCFSPKIEYNVDESNPYYYSNYDDEGVAGGEIGLYAINENGDKLFIYDNSLDP